MQPPSEQTLTCPNCGGVLQKTSAGELGCMSCLLRAGIGSEEGRVHDSTPDPLQGGVRFGVYEIDCHADGSLCELGRGAMGVTYRATDTSLQRKVALKIIKIDIAERSADARERFMREARAAAALRHENIATVHQFGMRLETGQYFYAMELIDGETLEERVRRAGPLDARTTIEIAQQVTSALTAAEKHGLVHRDLKPANLMLVSRDDETNDKKLLVKIIDFGLAKAVHTATDPKSLTHDRFVGTPAFASPEQFEHSALDVRSDIYSLGETLWFALTGKTPFGGRNVEEIHRAQKSNVLPIEQLQAAHVPHRLKSMIESMLAFEPASRPSTHELAACVKRCSPEAKSVRRMWVALAASALVVLGLSALFVFRPSRIQEAALNPASDKSIAVLPFENLSEEKANAYFAEGIQNEILTRLATVHDLKVISRTSTAKYQSKPDNLRTVAQELGVSTILEGAVQKAGDKVRVNVQLIDARADTHLWAKSYDRELKDVLGVESEVSQEIAEALQANLSPSESQALTLARARDAEAYDLFLRGEYEFQQASTRLDLDAYDRAEAFYRQALARDPNFAEAAAGLARTRLSRHWRASPLAARELEEVKSIIDRALALAPNSPEAHSALGLFFYWGHRQYEMALTEFNRTLELQPNNTLARQYCAYVYRRRGEWERSLGDFQRAQKLDPRDADIPAEMGNTYRALRLWKDAERAELRALAIDPHNWLGAQALVETRLDWTGDVDSARRALDGFPEDIKGSVIGLGGLFAVIKMPVYLDVMERRFTDAFQAFEKQVAKNDREHLYQVAARVALRVLAGQTELAKSAGEEAQPLLEARLRERPDDTFVMAQLACVYLALGRNADALRLARRVAASMPIEKDAFSGPGFEIGLAQIEARAGAPEEAIKRLRHLLSIPAGQAASIARLKIDPVWDPIRDRPDFQQLLLGPEQIGPNK
jgi:serine/threonine-protein kinase